MSENNYSAPGLKRKLFEQARACLINQHGREPFVHPYKDEINKYIDERFPGNEDLREQMLSDTNYSTTTWDENKMIEVVVSPSTFVDYRNKNMPVDKMTKIMTGMNLDE